MQIRCRCGKVTDLKDTGSIMFYLSGGPIKCRECGADIERKEKTDEKYKDEK